MTTSLKSPSPTTTSATNKPLYAYLLRGGLLGLAAGLAMILGAWLSPLASADRPALALLAVTVSVPVGALAGRRTAGLRDAGGVIAGAGVAGLLLASSMCLVEPVLWVRLSSWCVAAAILGASLQSMARGGGLVASSLWLFLCGLLFFYDRLPWGTETLETWAVEGCPWIGFSHLELGGDPLRLSIIYMGHWTALSDEPVAGTLTAGTLWLAALFAFAGLLATTAVGQNAAKTRHALGKTPDWDNGAF